MTTRSQTRFADARIPGHLTLLARFAAWLVAADGAYRDRQKMGRLSVEARRDMGLPD